MRTGGGDGIAIRLASNGRYALYVHSIFCSRIRNRNNVVAHAEPNDRPKRGNEMNDRHESV